MPATLNPRIEDFSGLDIVSADAKVFVRDPDSESVLRNALDDAGIKKVEFKQGTVQTAISALAKEPSPRLLVVDISGVKDPSARMAELSQVCEPDIDVFAVGDRNDIVLYRDLKAAGIVEYFVKPLVKDVAASAFSNVLAPQAAQTSTKVGKLIFVIGVKGGTGASTIASSASWYLSEAKRRNVLLLDLDLYAGDTALQLDVSPGNTLREALEYPDRVDRLFLERGVTQVSERLHLLAGLEPLQSLPPPVEDGLPPLLEKLQSRYRYVVIDLPARSVPVQGSLLRLPGTYLLVANGRLPAARDAARWRERAGPNVRERTTLTVLNRTEAHGGLTEADFAQASGRSPDVVIPYNRELAEAANFGIAATRKCATFHKGLARILGTLIGERLQQNPNALFRVFR